MMSATDLGQRLRAARLHALLSQEDVAQRMGVTRGTIARWEAGTRDISFTSLQALADALGAPLVRILAPESTPTAASTRSPGVAASGAEWDRLHPLERQSIDQIVTVLVQQPEQLPRILQLLSEGLQPTQQPSGAERERRTTLS